MRREDAVKVGLPVSQHGDADMVELRIVLQPEGPVGGRVAAAHHHRQPVAAQGLAPRPRRQGHVGEAEGEVDMAVFHLGDDVRPDRLDLHQHAGRLPLQPPLNSRSDEDGVGVGGGEADRAADRLRIERRGDIEALQRRQGLLQFRGQRLSPRREDEPAPPAHQQGIPQDVAQSCERAAHGGLAEAHILRRPGDVAPPQQRVEHGEQVEINAG